MYIPGIRMEAFLPFDSRRFRDALSRFPTGVVIVTAATRDGERLGMTMSSFNSVSLDPPLVLFSIRRAALAFAQWCEVTHYAVNVLAEEQEGLSNQFARARGDKWDGVTPRIGGTGAPLMPNASVAFECAAHARHDGGDHEIFIGRVVEIHEQAARRPLVFFEGRYRRLAAAASATPPEEALLVHGW